MFLCSGPYPPVCPPKQHRVQRKVMRTSQKDERISKSTYTMLLGQIVKKHTPIPVGEKHFVVRQDF